MDDVFTAMLAMALSAVMLVAGQQYVSRQPEITAAMFAPLPHIAGNNTSSSYVR
jgi:hypothetical protein